ncbi:MAG: MFS transporter [Acetobacteraceae bacterium]
MSGQTSQVATQAATSIGGARFAVIALSAFVTVVDLFAAQAILPALRESYMTTPAMMSAAVNASTIGMAVGSFATALLSHRIERRRGIMLALALLAIPTVLLGQLPSLAAFTLLRVLQGVCMATAFTLMLAYLGEATTGRATPAAFAAYITGNVASNLVGRLIAAGVADHLGLGAVFRAFALLNLAGALLVAVTVARTPPPAGSRMPGPLDWVAHFRNRRLLADFGLGFCILFAFIGTFTFVNFVLVRAPLSLGMMQVGLAYVVFLPSIITTPLAGVLVRRTGVRTGAWAALGTALIGLPLLLLPSLAAVLAGMVLVAVGTFMAQAIATGFVGRAASGDRGSASGIYLASYFGGGLVGSLVLGQVFERAGWTACVVGIGVSLTVAAFLAIGLRAAPMELA